MTEVSLRSATQLARMIREKEISSLELTEHYIERIERLDAEINAVVVRDFEAAREGARQADAKLADGGALGPLHGVPMTVKEAYDIEGQPTTWGILELKDNKASSDSVVVRQLKAAGAVLMGKTNVPVMLGDFQSYNKIYGTTRNPWNPERTPGGSSGGSSAALAAGFTALECGSDIGGSIRNPAHYCGVYGHKPTFGIVPMQGHALPGQLATPDISVCGPLARSAEDLALAMEVVAGPSPLDRPGWKLDLPKPAKTWLAEYRVAVWPTDECCPVDTTIADRASQLADQLAKLGATVSDRARPDIDWPREHITYLSLLNSILGATLPPEQRAQAQAVADATPPSDMSHDAVMARAAVLSHRDWVILNEARESLRYAWREFFAEWDILICPQTSTTAFAHDHRPFRERTIRVNGEDQPYFQQIFWAGIVTASYLPSSVFPTGPAADGLPIGLQAVGAEYHDRTTIDFTRLLADEIGGFQAPPGYE